ncbi:MAG: hypothetical protein Q8Q24_00855, partial [bacterium]|nr:hypothetical protein [bacterium]
ANKLVKVVSEPGKKDIKPGEELITVSRTVSAAAVAYETARNAVEFRAEHLIRRATIERILKRRVLTNPTGIGIGEALVRELLWARYLDNDGVPVRKIDDVQEVVNKYLALRKEVLQGKSLTERNSISDWLIGIASCEIEKNLVPAPNREALINFTYQTLQKRIALPLESNQKTHDIQVYIAVHRGFALSDEAVTRFHLFASFFPEWETLKTEDIHKMVSKFTEAYKEIEKQLNYPLKEQLRRFVIKEVAPFNVIRDLVESLGNDFARIASEQELLEEKARRILNKRYQETGTKLRRAAFRSIIYIFLTKMFFALILELPFDKIIGNTNYFALVINTLFPPALMFAVTASIKLPGEDNTRKITQKIREYVFDDTASPTVVSVAMPPKTQILGIGFTIIYLLTYLLIFGGIIYLLRQFQFSIVSIAIFLFFLSVVSFFGYRVRGLTKDYELAQKERAFTPLIDFLFLPILRVGQWLSRELTQINVLIFIFDFIIEAPFKAFFLIVEEWIRFMKAKKEEIIA